MNPDEVRILIRLAHGEVTVLVCDSWNDVYRIREWLEQNYPYLRVRPRGEPSGKIRLRVAVRWK